MYSTIRQRNLINIIGNASIGGFQKSAIHIHPSIIQISVSCNITEQPSFLCSQNDQLHLTKHNITTSLFLFFKIHSYNFIHKAFFMAYVSLFRKRGVRYLTENIQLFSTFVTLRLFMDTPGSTFLMTRKSRRIKFSVRIGYYCRSTVRNASSNFYPST